MSEPIPEPVNTMPPGPPKKDYASLAIVGVLLLAAIAVGWHQVTGGRLLADESPAPAFMFRKYQGGTVSLAELKGRVVVLNFWASWCPPCREELPWVVKLGAEFESQGVTLVAASVDEEDVASELVGNVTRILPGLDRFAAFANEESRVLYKVGPIPTTYVIDRNGKVYASIEGEVSESTLRRWITGAMAVK